MPEAIILRGVTGSGKTALSQKRFPAHVYCSADDYHYVVGNGKYDFKKENLAPAHRYCLRRFFAHAQESRNNILVDNTNIRAWEIAPYYAAGEAFGYSVKILTLECDPQVALMRNVHGVPERTFWDMYFALIAEKLPPHWNHQVITP